MIRPLLIFTLFIFCSCNKKQVELELKNVAAEPSIPRDWVKDVIKDHDHWLYLTAVPFADGGSVAMGFMNLEGEMLHVLFDYSIGHDQDYRRCYIQRSFNDSEAIELERGSKLEAKVISMADFFCYRIKLGQRWLKCCKRCFSTNKEQCENHIATSVKRNVT